MNYTEFKEKVIQAAKDAAIANYELYYSNDDTTSIETFKEEVTHFTSSNNAGVNFRCVLNNKIGNASTQLFTEETAVSLVQHAVENASSIENEDFITLPDNTGTYEQTNAKIFKPATSGKLIEAALGCQKLIFQSDNRIADASQTFTESRKKTVWLCNSKGLDLNHEYAYDIVYINAIINNGETMYPGESYKINNLNHIQCRELVKEAVEEAISIMNPQKISSGKYNIVLSGKMAATLLQTFFSIFSAEEVQQGLSLLSGKQNTCIASDCVCIIDDPFYSDSLLQMPFDAEGTPTYTKNIIENGTLKTYLYDSRSASKDHVQSSGNALRLSYSSPISIMPYNLYFKPGTDSFDTLLNELKDGLYITNLQGMHSGTDSSTGDFSLASSGYLIKDGKKSSAVKQFTISGNFYTLLKQIKNIADDIDFLIPKGCSCFGSPSMLIEDISVAGE